jgi:hypothetical protein
MSKLIVITLALLTTGCVTFEPSQREPYYKTPLNLQMLSDDNRNEIRKVKDEMDLLRDKMNLVTSEYNHLYRINKTRIYTDTIPCPAMKLEDL